MPKAILSAVIAALLLSSPLSNAAEERTISPMQVSFGSVRLDRKKALELAKFDVVVIDRFGYDRVATDTWSLIKKNGDTANNKPTLLLYQLGPFVRDDTDKQTPFYLNNVGRYNNERGVSGDATAVSKQDWFLKNNQGSTLTAYDAHTHYLDFGNKDFRDYWKRVTQSDIVKQKWKADGVFMDVSSPFYFTAIDKVKGTFPAKYSDAQSWDTAMNGFISDAAGFLRQNGQKTMPNRSYGNTATGYEAWLALDKMPTPPDYVLDEGAFVTSYGPVGDAQFYQVAEWERQVNLASKIKNSRVVYLSHTYLGAGGSGLSSAGTPITFQQVFQFALGSYLIALPQSGPKPLFSFDYDRRKTTAYTQVKWLPVYDQLNLGAPLSDIQKQQSGAATIYSKKFEKGTVYVNPTKMPSANVQFAGMLRVTPDWEKGLIEGKPGEAGIIAPFSAVIFMPVAVPNAPVLNIQQ